MIGDKVGVEGILKSLYLSGLTGLYLRRLRNVGRHLRRRGHSIAQAAVALWTSDDLGRGARPVFQELNEVLVHDDPRMLCEWMWLVRIASEYIQRPSNRLRADTITWRGSQLSQEQAASLRTGEVIRPPMFVSTSTSRDVAVSFRDKHGAPYLVRCRITRGCPNACSLRAVSEYNDELEVLLPPYTPVRIVAVVDGVITVDVLDGKEFMFNVEQPSGRLARAFPI
eukprot:gene44538-22876_t